MLLALLLTLPADAASARWSFVDAYDNVNKGDWYRGYDNESATLAWGESYVMMSLTAMYRVTGDPGFLERLTLHADDALAQRDDARGVTDYRGDSGACWRNTSYQDGEYCYVVHSGMLIQPMVEFARLVARDGLEAEVAPDGQTFGDKAAAYVAAAEETVAFHEEQWDDAGYYIFRADADFLTYAGVDLPLNQSGAMGRALITLWQVTGEEDYRDKAEALAQRFYDQLTASGGGWYWNYWGGSYSAPGEDVSHAAINVDFAVRAAEAGLVFSEADIEGFAETFMQSVYQDDRTFSDDVGGGATNGSSYLPQVGRWLRLTPYRTGVYAAVRDLYEEQYPAASIGSGSILLGWALLAEQAPDLCEHFFYYVDWEDQGEWQQATAYGANVLTAPPALEEGCLVPLSVEAARETTAQQWDGAAYHDVARWSADSAERLRHVPYEPAWPYPYYKDGVLFQFADSFVSGEGIRVRQPEGRQAAVITSTPPTEGEAGAPLVYAPTGEGTGPFWWSLAEFPAGARVDPESGALDWAAPAPGEYAFTLVLENDLGEDTQSFSVSVPGPPEDTGDSGLAADTEPPPEDTDPPPEDTEPPAVDTGPGDTAGDYLEGYSTSAGCQCGKGDVAWLLWLAPLLGLRRRYRKRPTSC